MNPNDDSDDETDACPIHGRQEVMNSRHLSDGVRAAWSLVHEKLSLVLPCAV